MSRSVDEVYDVYNELSFKARKAHECAACELPIRPGDRYTRVFTLFDSRKESIKRCARCQFIHKHLRTLCKDNDVWPDEALDCGNDYTDEWGEQPQWLAALAFWLPGEPLPCCNPCTVVSDRLEQCWRRVDYSWLGRRCQLFALPLGPYSFSNPCSGEPTL